MIHSVFAVPILNLYIGSNYIAQDTIDRIQATCKCQVNQSYFNDNYEMLSKMQAGASGYSVIVPTSYAVHQLVQLGKLLPLDFTKLPNAKYLNPVFMNLAYDKGNKYSLPYAYTPVFLAYNATKMQQLGIVPNSWKVVFDPKYLVKLKGKVTMFNSSKNVISAALLYLGKDPNSINIHDLEQAKDVIDKASPYWAKFDSDNYYRGLLRGDIWISMSYSIDIFKAINDAKASHSPITIGAMLQQEGNMYELDNLVIPVTTPNVDLSYALINTVLQPQSEFELTNLTGASVPNVDAIKRLPAQIAKLAWIYPPNMQHMYVFDDYPPKIRLLVNEMWTEIQMTCRHV